MNINFKLPKIRKVLCSAVTAAMITTSMVMPINAFADTNQVKVYYQNQEINFDVAPEIIDDYTMVPARAIFEAMGAKVKWDEDTQTVTVKKKKKSISMTIGGEIKDQDGNVLESDAVPVVVNDRTLVSVRLIAEFLGSNVQWDENDSSVYISDIEKVSDDSWKENTGLINMTTMSSTGDGVSIENNVVTITKGGDFEVTGQTSNGMIFVNTDEKVKLRLSGVDITNTNGPAIYFENVDKGYITLTEGTSNTLTDGSTYDYDDATAPLFSDDDLDIKGSGTLVINANYKHGIASDDDITIDNGNITINSTVSDGIHAKAGVEINDGTLNITAKGDGIQSDEWDVTVNGGNINVTTTGEVVSSSSNITPPQDMQSGTQPQDMQGGGMPQDMQGGGMPQDMQGGGMPQDMQGGGMPQDMQGGTQPGGQGSGNNMGNKNGMTQMLSGIDTSEFDGLTYEEIVTKLNEMVNDGRLTLNYGFGHGQQATTDTDTTEDETASSKGIKAEEDVVLNGGNINIHSTGHAIHSADIIEVNGSDIEIYSESGKGMSSHGDLTINSGNINIEKSTEGIESKAILTINDGSIKLVATDDGFNAGGSGANHGGGGMQMGNDDMVARLAQKIMNELNPSDATDSQSQDRGQGMNGGTGGFGQTSSGNNGHSLVINGGYVCVDARGDGLDSNGTMEINGGTVIINGPTSNGDSALDTDGEMTINGGTVVAMGSSGMLELPSENSNQNNIVAVAESAQAAETLISIKDSDGNVILTFKPSKTYQELIFSSPNIETGKTYTVSIGGSIEGYEVDGLYSNSDSYSGGTEIGSVQVESRITRIGTTTSGNHGFGRGGM